MIRSATLADLPKLVEMGVAFMGESIYGTFLTTSPEAIENLNRMLIEAPHGEVFVAERGGEVVGMIGVICTFHPHSGDSVMSELFWYVQPHARSVPGLGIRLLLGAEAWARSHGIKKSLVVAPNEEVEQLYERMGYKPLERQFIKDL